MRQFGTVLKFEFTHYLKSKVFVGITLAGVLIIAALLSFPRIKDLFGQGRDSQAQQARAEQGSYALNNQSTLKDDIVIQALSAALPDSRFTATDQHEAALRDQVDNGTYDAAIVLISPLEYRYLVKTVSMYDATGSVLDQVLLGLYRSQAMVAGGMAPQDVQDILSAQVRGEVLQSGKDQMQTFFYTYILIFLLYMAIMMYGQLVATSVATEKSSRAMELLITSARPNNLMFGKIIGSGLAGLAQMAVLLGSAFVFFNLNRPYWQDNAIIHSIFDMPLSILIYSLVFFILGYFIYAFLYGALGSLASRTEDINTSVMPITFLFIAAFFIAITGMTSGQTESPLMVIGSFIPFLSPTVMFVRIAMGEVALWEILLSIALLIISTIGLGYLCAKIYRIGVLLYGKPPKMGELVKMLRKS